MYGANVPEPEAVHCTKWFTDPLSLGSFHAIRAGVTRDDLKNLKRGIRNLHFAGYYLLVAYSYTSMYYP